MALVELGYLSLLFSLSLSLSLSSEWLQVSHDIRVPPKADVAGG